MGDTCFAISCPKKFHCGVGMKYEATSNLGPLCPHTSVAQNEVNLSVSDLWPLHNMGRFLSFSFLTFTNCCVFYHEVILMVTIFCSLQCSWSHSTSESSCKLGAGALVSDKNF